MPRPISPPRVSVVLAARDEEQRIAASVASIVSQTFRDWELLLVDDGSGDATADIVDAMEDSRIQVLRLPGVGHAAALRTGVAKARGALIARQDADDLSLPKRLERQVGFLDAHPEVAVLGTAWREVGPSGEEVRPRAPIVAGPLRAVLVRYNPVTHTTAMFRRDPLDAIGGYDLRYRWAQDYDLWLRADFHGLGVYNLPDVLAVRTMSGTNIAAQRERAQIREELVIRWRDSVRRGRRGDGDVAARLLALARRLPAYAAPLALKRARRRRRGQAP